MVKEDFKNENDLLRHIMTVDKNVEQGRALKKIFTTRENLFITGRAGSGKSTFMRRIVKFLGKCVIYSASFICKNYLSDTRVSVQLDILYQK